MNIQRITLLAVVALSAAIAFAQDDGQRSSSSLYLRATDKSDVSIVFDIKAEGKRYQPTWGLDLAWSWDRNLLSGLNHMGKENVGIGRTSFRVLSPLVDDTGLTADMLEGLRTRSNLFDKVSPTLPLVFNCDNGYMPDDYTGPYINTYYTANKKANAEHWAKCIEAHVAWMKQNTKHPIVGVSPFNEPDNALEKNLAGEIQGTPEDEASVAKLLKTYDSMQGIAITGGNTLNDDNALKWYNAGKQYYDWGNTHQLAGSFDKFANFYLQLQKDGKVGYGDEMHNVGEAMIGLEYGMTVGIWWGFDSRARGEFCQISRNGARLAYGEHRTNWTAASVYRHDDGRVKAFIGSSERQAATTKYQFVSKDRAVYYDGYGPYREFVMEIPGGSVGSYQNGQTGAERVIDVTWGEDVQSYPIEAGVYKIYNKSNGSVMALSGMSVVTQTNSATSVAQQWNIAPVSSRVGGDFSFFEITSANNSAMRLNLKDFSLVSGGEIMGHDKNAKADVNEQWYLEYADNGFFYIRNRLSALYLSASGSKVVQTTLSANASSATKNSMLWRILPVDVKYDRIAPATVGGLTAEAQTASVKLSWTANTETDLAGYLVLRAEKGTDDWNTVGRMVTANTFTDNTCRQGVTYIYKVKAVDKAQNRSRNASDEVEATPTGEHSLIAHWQMDGNLNDETANMMDAAAHGTVNWVDADKTSGKALRLQNNQYVQLPYEVAGTDELTIAMWVNMKSNASWQRLFDFGNDTDHYMFLTPRNGDSNVMRFAIKNGGSEQVINCKTALGSSQWKHVAVTIGKDKTVIYLDGKVTGSSTGITICPSDIHPFMNYIGRSQFAADPSLSAVIDDVRIYNYAVSADDVQTIMEGGSLTGVARPVADRQASPVVYGLDGVRRTAPQRGLNIIDGKKVVR